MQNAPSVAFGDLRVGRVCFLSGVPLHLAALMPRHLLASVAALASAVLLATIASPAFAQAGSPPPSGGVEELWSEYPLDPKPDPSPAETPPAQPQPERAPPSGGIPTPQPPPTSARGKDDSMDLKVLLAFQAALGILLVLYLSFRVVRAMRSSKEFGVAPSPGVIPVLEWPNADDKRSGAKPAAATAAGKARRPSAQSTQATVVPPEVPAQVPGPPVPQGRSQPVKFRETKVESKKHHEGEASGEESPAVGGAGYAQLGEQVTAVLTTAEQAASEIRESARRDAIQLRLDAEESTKAARHESEQIRTEADKYNEETRATADAYAEQIRRAADEQAAKARAALEQEVLAVRADAERKAKEIEAEALRRRDALAESTANMEQRIAGMATALRGMTGDLEGLLPTSPRAGEDQKARVESAELDDDAIEDALKPERAAAQSR